MGEMDYNGITHDEIVAIGRDELLRNDFEFAVNEALRELAAAGPRRPHDLLKVWARVLGNQSTLIEGSAVVMVYADTVAFDCSGGIPEPAWKALPSQLQREIRTHVTNGIHYADTVRSSGSPDFDGRQIEIEPIGELHKGVALAVVTKSRTIAGRMLKHAALQAGVMLASEARERGVRQMASRISKMCSSSILSARCRLEGLLHGEQPLVDALREVVTKAIADLDEAQQGFDRARLLEYPASGHAEPIDLGRFLSGLVASLKSVEPPVMASWAAKACDQATGVIAFGSKWRLNYALRDVVMLTWLLTKRNPVEIEIHDAPDDVSVRIVGGPLPDNLGGEDARRRLLDPDTLLIGREPHKAVRGIDLQLALILIRDENGKLTVGEVQGKLCFNVILPKTRRSAEGSRW